MKMRLIILILQLMCILVVTAGIAIEYYYEADLGFLFITAGSLFLAVATKINEAVLYTENKHLKKGK